MRDILNDLEAGKFLSDPDPVRRAQIQMKTHLPKRFYKVASVVPVDDQFDSYIELKMAEVMRFEMTPHPVEYDMYYSV
jgi:chaperone required for assembly of F1-ATPase